MHHEVNQVTDSPITPNDEALPFFKIDLVLSKLTEEH
jgi:hypothetical protein